MFKILLRSGGEVLYNRMTMRWEHPVRGHLWNPQGFTVVSDERLHVVPKNKLIDLMERTVDKNALPCIIPMIGTSDLNSEMWKELKKQLMSNNIKFLIPSLDFQTKLEDSGEYFKITSEEFAEKMLPYGQVEEMIKEGIELKAEFKDGRVKLSEPRSGTKDRIVCLSYANYIASKIENIYNQSLIEDDFNIDEINLVW